METNFERVSGDSLRNTRDSDSFDFGESFLATGGCLVLVYLSKSVIADTSNAPYNETIL